MDHRVLVVDDDPFFGAFAEMCLGELGFACYLAEDPDSAVQKAIRHRPQAIVLDCHLATPRRGLDMIPWFQRLLPESPIVMVSADESWDLAAHALLRGAYIFWRKSSGASDLLEAVSAAFDEYRMRHGGMTPSCLDAFDEQSIVEFHRHNHRNISHTSRALEFALEAMSNRYGRHGTFSKGA